MQLEEYFDFESEPVERIRIKGTRIDLEHVIGLYKGGLIPEQIAVHFAAPLPRELVYAAITYYLHNEANVEAYMQRREAIGEANYHAWLAEAPSEVLQRLRAAKTTRKASATAEPE